MKSYKPCLMVATCLILAGCEEEQSNREVLAKLDTTQSELADKKGATVLWALANKGRSDTAIFQWVQVKMEEARKAEGLPPETEQKIRDYGMLQFELLHKEMEHRG